MRHATTFLRGQLPGEAVNPLVEDVAQDLCRVTPIEECRGHVAVPRVNDSFDTKHRGGPVNAVLAGAVEGRHRVTAPSNGNLSHA